MPGRASALLILGLAALPACNRDGPEDPAIAAPGAGIPVGAVGAAGVGFDALPASAAPRVEIPRAPRRKPIPLDPFADPPGAPSDEHPGPHPGAAPDNGGARPPGATPHLHPHPPKGTTL